MAFQSEIAAKDSRLKRQPFALLALALGLVTILIAAGMLLSGTGELTRNLDVRWLLPPAALSTIAAAVSFLRHEGTRTLPLIGLALAASGLVFGWLVIVGLVALGTIIVIGVLSLIL